MKEPSRGTTVGVYLIGVIGTFLIMIGLIWIMYYYTRPPAIDQARAAERRKNLAELMTQSKEQLENYAWINQVKGIVRLPIARSMELTVQEWQNGVAFRSNLLYRFQQATNPISYD